jgi:hypothetical protein
MKHKFVFRAFPGEGPNYFLEIRNGAVHTRGDIHNCLMVNCTVEEAYVKAAEIKSSIEERFKGWEIIPELVEADFEKDNYINEIKELLCANKHYQNKLHRAWVYVDYYKEFEVVCNDNVVVIPNIEFGKSTECTGYVILSDNRKDLEEFISNYPVTVKKIYSPDWFLIN